MKIVIVGPPKSGKTTLAMTYPDCERIHGDDFIELGWSESSQAVADLLSSKQGDVVAEGVCLPRSLRKMLEANPDVKPCDKVVFLCDPYLPLNKGQLTMAKGINTVWSQIEKKLSSLGVEIEFRRKDGLGFTNVES